MKTKLLNTYEYKAKWAAKFAVMSANSSDAVVKKFFDNAAREWSSEATAALQAAMKLEK